MFLFDLRHHAAGVGVPGVVTVHPGQRVCERRKQVEEDLSNNDVVVQTDEPRHNHHSIAQTCGRQSIEVFMHRLII